MNAFYEHHKDSIRFGYRCFDRLLLNGLIQPFQQPERVVGFFNFYRQQYPVSRDVLRDIAGQFQNRVVNRSQKWGAPILDAPESRRDEFMKPYFRKANANQVVAIVKGREPARIMIAIGNKKDDRWHLQIAQRWVVRYNFYVNDERWGPMFVRMCPYLPFSARVCLNQHHWLAQRMREEDIDFQQCTNAFLRCSDPARLQELSDSLSPRDLLTCGQKWLTTFTPFFTERERNQGGCQHRLFFAQVEYCDNLIFRRRAALDQMGERLLDANRTIGQPNKITVIFGRRITKQYRGKLQTVIEDLDLPNPVIRSHYGNGFLKQYVRDHVLLRTEPASNNVADYGVKKAVENLPQLRKKIAAVIDNYHNVQQDILETFIDGGQLRKLAQPTVMPNGKRIPGLKLDHPRQLALMHALVRFSHIAAQGAFTTPEIYADTLTALETSSKQYSLASLRYDLSKLRAKGLVEKVPRSRRYRLLPEGYSICLRRVAAGRLSEARRSFRRALGIPRKAIALVLTSSAIRRLDSLPRSPCATTASPRVSIRASNDRTHRALMPIFPAANLCVTLPSLARFNQSNQSRSSWLIAIRSIPQPIGCQDDLLPIISSSHNLESSLEDSKRSFRNEEDEVQRRADDRGREAA